MNTSSIFVSWGPIPSEGRNGIIIGYGLFYAKHDASRPDWKQQTCHNTYGCAITSLDMFTRYDIAITGLTVKGSGVPVFVGATTEKGGKSSLFSTNYLLTESDVFTGKSQTETLRIDRALTREVNIPKTEV